MAKKQLRDTITMRTVTMRKKKRKKATERAPLYCEKVPGIADGSRRVVSRPNGLWRAEKRGDPKRDDRDHNDFWIPISGDGPKDMAIAAMANAGRSV